MDTARTHSDLARQQQGILSGGGSVCVLYWSGVGQVTGVRFQVSGSQVSGAGGQVLGGLVAQAMVFLLSVDLQTIFQVFSPGVIFKILNVNQIIPL